MRTVSLDGNWELIGFPQGAYECTGPGGLADVPVPPVAARVPGNVELDLIRAGLLPEDIYRGKNILKVQDFEQHEWWYRRTFPTPEHSGSIILRFDGLDLIATIWVNGREIGRTANMFIEHEFDVTEYLTRAGGNNELVVRLGSAVRAAAAFDYPPEESAQVVNAEQIHLRKAPHMFGWDIMPRVVSAGIWRSVSLELREKIRIASVFFQPWDVSDRFAHVRIRWQIEAPPEDWAKLAVRVTGRCGDSVFETERPVRFMTGDLGIDVPNPKLWWPHGYGDQPLYDVMFDLLLDGQVVDRRAERIGLRTVALERTETTSADNPGEFVFRVNDEKILAKGSNWVPADAFHSRDGDRIPRIMELMKDIGCNMVRCWGGNVYEDHLFFDLCDEMGFLVWQDFAMACGRYPQTDEFAEQLRTEAESVVAKLRNHPSLAVWCGDNECDEGYYFNKLDPNTNRLTREVLPAVVRRLDPWRPYLPSSPYHSPEMMKTRNLHHMPERHLWGSRAHYKSRFFSDSLSHFVSETGYHGCPNRAALERFLDPDALWPWQGNEQWRVHATDVTKEPGPYAYRIELMAKQIGATFGTPPEELTEFIVASQIVEAEAVKFFLEMTRLVKWRRTGVLWWNLIDGWPQFSDSVVDYYGGKKLAYHYIRRAQMPLHLMVAEPVDWDCKVVMGNDSLKPRSGSFHIREAGAEDALLEGRFSVPANENAEVGKLKISHGEQRLFLLSWESDGEEGGSHYLLGSPPFDFAQYRTWLPEIAALPNGFGVETVGVGGDECEWR